uniref:Uncharacterized protein n=1 Tax=Panagrolaimus sp. JU765 TaxID=591449 RepID=A0AC34RHM4_9BILA
MAFLASAVVGVVSALNSVECSPEAPASTLRWTSLLEQSDDESWLVDITKLQLPVIPNRPSSLNVIQSINYQVQQLKQHFAKSQDADDVPLFSFDVDEAAHINPLNIHDLVDMLEEELDEAHYENLDDVEYFDCQDENIDPDFNLFELDDADEDEYFDCIDFVEELEENMVMEHAAVISTNIWPSCLMLFLLTFYNILIMNAVEILVAFILIYFLHLFMQDTAAVIDSCLFRTKYLRKLKEIVIEFQNDMAHGRTWQSLCSEKVQLLEELKKDFQDFKNFRKLQLFFEYGDNGL